MISGSQSFAYEEYFFLGFDASNALQFKYLEKAICVPATLQQDIFQST
jgi:hypothetical protein